MPRVGATQRMPRGHAGERSRDHLTPRQREILRLVAQGLTNREIADTLKISVRTVEVHRFNLMRRLRGRDAQLNEDLADLAAMAERRQDATVDHAKLVERLKADGLL